MTALFAVAVGLIAARYMENANRTAGQQAQDAPGPAQQVLEEPVTEDGRQPFLEEEEEEEEEVSDFDDSDEEYDIDFARAGGNLPQGGVEAEINLNEAGEPQGRYANMTAAEILAARQAEQAEQGGAAAGPSRRANRVVGKKKTRSLARRDQIRAYNEFVRQQAEAQRNAEREYNEKFGDMIEQERRARQERESAAAEAKRAELARKRLAEEEARAQIQQRREIMAKTLNTNGKVKLNDENDRLLAEQIPGGTIVAGGEWLVSIDESQYQKIADTIKTRGRVSFEELAKVL